MHITPPMDSIVSSRTPEPENLHLPISGINMPDMGTKQKSRVSKPPKRTSLADVLFSTVQQRVLGYLFGQPECSFYATELIRFTGGGSGAVQCELARRRPANCHIVFQALPHTLDREPEVWRMLAKCHEIRNLGEYEGNLNIDDKLVADLITACRAVATKLTG